MESFHKDAPEIAFEIPDCINVGMNLIRTSMQRRRFLLLWSKIMRRWTPNQRICVHVSEILCRCREMHRTAMDLR